MILVSIVQIYHVAIVVIREVIAIAPLNRWNRHITSHNTASPKFALSAYGLFGCIILAEVFVPTHDVIMRGRANFRRSRDVRRKIACFLYK
jgi:hypothetical protein